MKVNSVQDLKYVAGTILGLYVLKNIVFKVEPGYQAIKFDLITGVGKTVYKEGYHLLIPFLQKPLIFDCRLKNYNFTCICGTKDLQIVTLHTRLIAKPSTSYLPELYRLLGFKYEDKIFHSIVYEIAGCELSQYNASQIIGKRDQISFNIKHKLQDKAKEFYVDLEDVALIDITFSKEFSEAIEKKQVAQQEAERMKWVVGQALEDKKSTIIKARGEAESVQKFGEANKLGSAFLELRKIEVARVISQALKDSSNKILLDCNSLYMNLPKMPKEKI